MPRQAPYLQRRGDTYSFRIAVPTDLRVILGAREYVRALRTPDRRAAMPLALFLASKALILFAELRAMPDDQRKAKSFDYCVKFNFNEGGEIASMEVEGEPHEQDAINSTVKTALLNAPRATQVCLPIATPIQTHRSQPAASVASQPTFKMVVDGFLMQYEKKNKPAMLKKHQPVLNMLLDVVGNKSISDIKQADINVFFDLLDKLPPRWGDECRKKNISVRQLAELDHETTIGPKTFVDTYVASVRYFLKSAKRDWQDQGFPMGLTTDGIEYLGDREEGESKQRAFKMIELRRLFEGAEMKSFANDPEQSHYYWLPILGLFTGARVNEICQLNPQADILKDEESGVLYFWITKDTESDSRIKKSVKTGDSRKIPIHKKIIELGFLEYLNRLKLSGAKLLFPSWKPINRRASGEAEKWFRQFLRDIKLRDETPGMCILGMHAFRHTLLTYGAMQNPPLSLFCITGHAQEEAPIFASGAGKGYLTLSLLSPLSDRSVLLDKLDYGVIIPGLCDS